jgi:hypothetical protein
VALCTLELEVPALQGITGVLFVVEVVDLEALCVVAMVTGSDGLAETKLPGMRIFVAAFTVSRNPSVARPLARRAIRFRR